MNISNTSVLKQILIDKFLRSPESYAYKLNQSDRSLLIILASYMGTKDNCWPSYKSLILDTGIGSNATINKSGHKLESLNILTIERTTGVNNNYTFTDEFIVKARQICNRPRQICNQTPTDLSANNINNNINNKKPFASHKNQEPFSNVESQSTSVVNIKEHRQERPSLILDEYLKKKGGN